MARPRSPTEESKSRINWTKPRTVMGCDVCWCEMSFLADDVNMTGMLLTGQLISASTGTVWYQLFVHTPAHSLPWFISPDKQMIQHPEFSRDIERYSFRSSSCPPNVLDERWTLANLSIWCPSLLYTSAGWLWPGPRPPAPDLGFSQLRPLAKWAVWPESERKEVRKKSPRWRKRVRED